MNALVSLYLTRNGRLSRLDWWVAILGLIGVSVIVKLALSVIGIGVAPMAPVLDPLHPEVMLAQLRDGSIGGGVTLLLLAYPGYCVSLKRQHDRDKSGLMVLVLLAAGLAALGVNAFGPPAMVIGEEFNAFVMPSLWSIATSTAFGLYACYVIAMLGAKAGTEGDNRYGPPPPRRDWLAGDQEQGST